MSYNLVDEWSKPVSLLRDIMDLAQYLNGPLSYEQKIPVFDNYLERLTQSRFDLDGLSRAEAEALFRPTEHDPDGPFANMAQYSITIPTSE